MELFLQGLIFGLAIAAPVGPIGVLTMRRTLVNGLWSGLLSGLGAASADAIYGMIAALGLTAVSTFLIQQQTWLRLIGGLFLLYLGIQTLRAKPLTHEQLTVNNTSIPENGRNHSQLPTNQLPFFSAYLSTLLLTLANPVTILSFTAVFAGFGIGSQTYGAGSGLMLVLGVFLGSTLWWLILVGTVTAVRTYMNNRIIRLINLVSGFILVGFAIILLSMTYG